ncbi:MAG TPA: PP2C family protein-serine/threonine phosphatase [Planctomycetaceae bacterium]|nr:PP2C family protein-serine/threonine phosphatase [Planctomycetaceae bacterium]
MRILVFWDNQEEADLIEMYLNPADDEESTAADAENEAQVVVSAGDFETALNAHTAWDVVFLNLSWNDPEQGVAYFEQTKSRLRDAPIVGACFTQDVFRLAQYITQGLRSYLIRDSGKDFIFLIQTTLESAVESVRSERERIISEKLREEIDSVRKLQESILPKKIKCPEPYSVVARYESSQIRVYGGQPVTLAGGDYYDVFALDDHRIVFLLGDASGHGMRACMSIMTMHTLVNMIRNAEYSNTAAFVAEINRQLCDERIVNQEGFITLLYGILDVETHQFQWTSAGHPIPMLISLESGEIQSLGGLDDGGLPLGIYGDAEYDSHSSHIPPGSRLLLYTDGLEEAFPDGNRDAGQFGIEGIEKTLESSRVHQLPDALQALFDDSLSFTRGAGRHDDSSAVLLERAVEVLAKQS